MGGNHLIVLVVIAFVSGTMSLRHQPQPLKTEGKHIEDGISAKQEASLLVEADSSALRPFDNTRPSYAAGNSKMVMQMRILNRLLQTYDWRIRPTGTNDSAEDGGPVIVHVNIYLRTISKVDDVNMEYSLHFTFREEWNDTRLAYDDLISDANYSLILPSNATIWMPDTFFQNEKDGRFHMIDKPNVMIKIRPTGSVLYSVRLTLMMSCPMNLQNYPLDIQECFVNLSSYAYTTDDIVYRWKLETPIQIKPGLHNSLPSFTLIRSITGICTSTTMTGTYGCLSTILTLKREFSYYLLQLYIPSFLLVGVSWVSFWLDKDSAPARVTLGVTTLLTMTTQAGGINAKLPPVSYTKAIDVWIGVCLVFIFGALLEFALVNYAARVDLLESNNKVRKPAKANPPPKPAARMDRLYYSVPTTPTVFKRECELLSSDIMKSEFFTGCVVEECKSEGIIRRNQVDALAPAVVWQYRSNKNVSYEASCTRDHSSEREGPVVTEKQKLVAKCDCYNTRPHFVCDRAKRPTGSRKARRARVIRLGRCWPRLNPESLNTRAKRIDFMSRFIFPITFLLFNGMYWNHYLVPYMAKGNEGNQTSTYTTAYLAKMRQYLSNYEQW